MSGMIERVARASFDHWRSNANRLGIHLDKGQRFEDMDEGELRFALAHARAVIAALREPTAAMVDAVLPSIDRLESADGQINGVWRAMIDAALEDG
jgi:hypothetical protein